MHHLNKYFIIIELNLALCVAIIDLISCICLEITQIQSSVGLKVPCIKIMLIVKNSTL